MLVLCFVSSFVAMLDVDGDSSDWFSKNRVHATGLFVSGLLTLGSIFSTGKRRPERFVWQFFLIICNYLILVPSVQSDGRPISVDTFVTFVYGFVFLTSILLVTGYENMFSDILLVQATLNMWPLILSILNEKDSYHITRIVIFSFFKVMDNKY